MLSFGASKVPSRIGRRHRLQMTPHSKICLVWLPHPMRRSIGEYKAKVQSARKPFGVMGESHKTALLSRKPC
jgi:hypothetical protein